MIALALSLSLSLGAAEVDAPAAPPAAVAAAPTLFRAEGHWRWGRLLGAGAVVAGAVVLGIAAVYGFEAMSFEHQRNRVCTMNPCVEPSAYRLYEQARTSQNDGVALAVTGGVLVAAGALLFVFKGDF